MWVTCANKRFFDWLLATTRAIGITAQGIGNQGEVIVRVFALSTSQAGEIISFGNNRLAGNTDWFFFDDTPAVKEEDFKVLVIRF